MYWLVQMLKTTLVNRHFIHVFRITLCYFQCKYLFCSQKFQAYYSKQLTNSIYFKMDPFWRQYGQSFNFMSYFSVGRASCLFGTGSCLGEKSRPGREGCGGRMHFFGICKVGKKRFNFFRPIFRFIFRKFIKELAFPFFQIQGSNSIINKKW